MAWLARSFANTLRLTDSHSGDDSEEDDNLKKSESEGEFPSSTKKDVISDLSDFTKTLTTQFWGVASLLSQPQNSNPSISGSSDESRIDGIKSDLNEISNQFKSGVSLISNAKVVSEVSKMASSFLHFGSEDEKDELVGVGIDEDVVFFARNLAAHPKTWLDFPDLDSREFELSDSQKDHAFAIEQFAPELADLKIKLCPILLSEGRFWKIYFVLLYSILDKHNAELLSTPQILQARDMLLHNTKSHNEPKIDSSDEKMDASSEEKVVLPVQTESSKTIDKLVIEEELNNLKQEEITKMPINKEKDILEEDFSFSDLEDFGDDNIETEIKLFRNKNVGTGTSSESNGSNEWLEAEDFLVG